MNDMNIRLRLEILITEREGMIAENKVRESLGQSMAYREDAFIDVARRMEALYVFSGSSPVCTPTSICKESKDGGQ